MEGTIKTPAIFDFDKDVPAAVKPEIERALKSIAWLIPPWVQECSVRWVSDPDDEAYKGGAAAAAGVDYAYRRLCIKFTSWFLEETPETREQICVHEIIHASGNLVCDYAWEEIKRLLPEDESPKHRGTLLDELERRNESMTQDLAFCIQNKMKAMQAEIDDLKSKERLRKAGKLLLQGAKKAYPNARQKRTPKQKLQK